MKLHIYILIAILFAVFKMANAQQEEVITHIVGVGRYTNNAVELRWIPEHLSVSKHGFKNGYLIERTNNNTKKAQIIAKVFPYTKASFDSLIAIETDNETNVLLSFVSDIIYGESEKNTDPINLEEGIGDIKNKKGASDMNDLILSLSAIKNSKVAAAMGFLYIDKSAMPNTSYTYTISPIGKIAIYKVEPAKISLISTESKLSYQSKIYPYPGEGKFTFFWEANPQVSGFFIERSSEANGPFVPINQTPFYASKGCMGVFSDDDIPNYTNHFYRIFGLNHFGEKVYIGSAQGMAVDKKAPAQPAIQQPKHISQNKVEIKWKMNQIESDLKGFIVARSDKDTGTFTILHPSILPPKTNTFIDTGFSKTSNNYYVIYAYDTAGNMSVSYVGYVVIIDSAGPTTPTILASKMDTLGVVKISIEAPKDLDLMGYKIYRANGSDHEFSLVNNVFPTDTTWLSTKEILLWDTVSLNTSTQAVYYKIKALDMHYNPSNFTPIIEVKRIDTIAPSAPVFTDLLVQENTIVLQFEPSPSEDVAAHIIYRKLYESDPWKPIVILKGTIKQYIDTGLVSNQEYYYTMKAIDKSNLVSEPANEVKGIPYNNGLLKKVTKLSANKTDSAIFVKWEYERKDKELSYIIYKEDKTGKLFQYAIVPSFEFMDKQKLAKNVYAIKVVHIDGSKSILSEKITVEIE
ncbi:MAG: hypothetical protein Q8R57_15045 [Bacteroidota bacterium]|nr:hypothetical protein [Bacteroidota bacterium]